MPDLANKNRDAQLNLDFRYGIDNGILGTEFILKTYFFYLKFRLNWGSCVIWQPYSCGLWAARLLGAGEKFRVWLGLAVGARLSQRL